MPKAPTAEEFLTKIDTDIYADGPVFSESGYSYKSVHKMLKVFAKIHVKAALEEAYNKAELIESDCNAENRCCMSNDMGDMYALSKHSIITSYPLNLVK